MLKRVKLCKKRKNAKEEQQQKEENTKIWKREQLEFVL